MNKSPKIANSTTLHISDDAPQELKDTIAVAQKMVDNMVKYKEKAENGTLTFEDLDELARLNLPIADEFPRNPNQPEGYPQQTSNMEELEKISKAAEAEAMKKLKESGDPIFAISSIEELKELAKLPPMAIIQSAQAAIAEKQKPKKQEKKETTGSAEKPKTKVGGEFHEDIFIENLKSLQMLLYNAKLAYYTLTTTWQEAELFEEQLVMRAKAFEDFHDNGKQFLIDVVEEKIETENEDELGEIRQEAAFALATVETESKLELAYLIEKLQKEDDDIDLVIQALKYGKNHHIIKELARILPMQTPQIQTIIFGILAHQHYLDPDLWTQVLPSIASIAKERVLRSFTENRIEFNPVFLEAITEDEKALFFPNAALTALLNGNRKVLEKCRYLLDNEPGYFEDLPFVLACGGDQYDYGRLTRCLETKETGLNAMKALGILGISESIPHLIQLLSPDIKGIEDWQRQKTIVESLELITNAGIELSDPIIEPGEDGKEHEVTVTLEWGKQWFEWWMTHHKQYESGIRYRRGRLFDLKSCIEEMEFPKGNYWSRQFAYYELQIRSGAHIAPFFADWYVEDQMESINKWKLWWSENQYQYPPDQWLFQGRTQ